MHSWFSKYLLSPSYNGYNVVYQGGHISFAGVFQPVPINQTGGFAVDCQTWGMYQHKDIDHATTLGLYSNNNTSASLAYLREIGLNSLSRYVRIGSCTS